ncbi:hypothetical protein BH20VER3_BH20VER3_08830 [soil metagenome]
MESEEPLLEKLNRELTERAALPEPEKWIQVYQEKANFFRVIHADGVWCSVSPAKLLHLTFYSERSPIPSKVFFPVRNSVVENEDASKREVKKDWFREMEVDVVVTIEAAKGIRAGLDNFIQIAEALIADEKKRN